MDGRAEFFYANIAALYANARLSPLSLALTICMGLALLLVPKRYAAQPILVVMLFITSFQFIKFSTVHITMLKIIIMFGWIRVIARREASSFRPTGLDKAVFLFGVCQILFYTLQRRSLQALVSSGGGVFDLIGLYFLFRMLITGIPEASIAIRSITLIVIPIALSTIIEQVTGKNLFSVFGGVPELPEIRLNRLRSQASFVSSILAGSFGATSVPLFVGIWKDSFKGRWQVIVGVTAAVVITIESSSSGPILALIAGLLGLFIWYFSKYMREILLLTVLAITGLAMVMKAPVYFLIDRLNIVGGSTGYHRAFLIDEFVHRVNEWWLAGVQSTAHWGPGLFDVTNMYIRVAVDGGIACLVLFLVVIVFAYREISRSIHLLDSYQKVSKRFLLWGLGAALFAHLVSFISVSYFDQIILVWYMLLAMIASIGVSLHLSEDEISNEIRIKK